MSKRKLGGEFGRLGIGILMLGLAIFVANSLDRSGPDSSAVAGQQDAEITPESEPVWQAPDRDRAIAPETASNGRPLARPVFDPPPDQVAPQPLNSALVSSTAPAGGNIAPLPRLDDQYRAGNRLNVTGTLQADDAELVPVQPKPGFTGQVNFAGRRHRVQPGDTLQSIATEHYGTADRYLDIYMANRHVLSNPARLPEGVDLKIPE